MAMISAFTTVDKTAHNSRTTSRDLWLSLEKAYAPHSTSREYTLKTQLLRIEMHGDETPDAYLNRAQEYADALAAIGELVNDKDLVMLVVSGLHEEYNGLKTTITARQSPTAFSELHALLSDHDYMLGKTRAPAPSITSSVELTAQLSSLRFQVCGIGHIPSQCPYRDPSTIRIRPSANFANTRAQSYNASANWHSDTGANSHVTPDLEAMDNSEAYYGDDALHVGNGKGLPILHIGSSKVYSPQKMFSLKNILHVLEISHNLLSVQKFCHDNDVFFEFHTSYFVVKDESTHTTLLTSPSKHGLYTITLPQLKSINKVSFLAVRASQPFGIDAQKSDVYSTFKSFVQMVERQFTTKLKNVQTDWGGEFRNLASFFSSLGIIHRRSCPHTSEQNGFVERRNRHVVETGLTLLAQACVPQRFWHYAFDTVVYLINRMPSRTSTNKSPFEHIFKRSPDYSFLRVFGCLCFPHLRPYNRHKMDFRSTPCVFLGYSPSHHGYRCLDISTERLYIARHVHFNEAQFPFDIPKTTSTPHSKTSPYYYSESPYVIPTIDHPSPSLPLSPISSPLSVSHLSPTSQTSPGSSNGQPSPVSTTSIPTPPPPTPPPPPPITRQRPVNLRQNPKQRVPYNPSANHATVLPTTITEPTSFTVANNSPEWRQAMKEEYDALMKNRTWSLVPRASNTNVVDDLGPLNYFLGIEIVLHVSGILLSQKKYILKLLQSAGLSNCNPVSSPMVTSSSLSLDDSTTFSNLVKYQKVVGSLQYVTLSRPDIAFAVNKLNMMLTGLEIQMIDGLRGAFLYILVQILKSWTARKQRTVSRSSTEAEYKALADTVDELTWLQALLNELGIRLSSTPILWCDNLGATYLSANPIFHARTKHVEIDYHFVREKVAQGDLRVQHISTHDQIADIFTKPLPTPRFLFLRSKLQVVARL
ncbi:retrovirus-related pol polyprotein from transposon TNT 1-94 [Tanacetum coccineum]